MEDEHYFSDQNIDPSTRRNVAFQTINALRETLTLAKKSQQGVRYEDTLQHLHDLSPAAYKGAVDLLQAKNESEDVKLFKEKAKARSVKEGKEITPIDLIDEELLETEDLIEGADDSGAMRKRRGQLLAAKEYFNPRTVSEHKLLGRDFRLAQHPLVRQQIYENESFKDYVLSNNNCLRLRLLHPDKAEAVLGADLVYEQFDLLNNQVRFVQMQYKAWDTKTLYTNEKRLQAQMGKMNQHLCKGGLCHSVKGTRHPDEGFRYPYCSAFLRPTTNKESADSKFKTTGQHLPICEALKYGTEKITLENMRETAVSNRIFEEQFLNNMIGSRWIHMDELDKFYKSIGLNLVSDTIRVHAQEFIIPSEEEIQMKKGRIRKK